MNTQTMKNEQTGDKVDALVGDLEELENILVRLYTRKQQWWGDMQPSYMTPKDLKGLLERGIHLVGKIREDSIPNRGIDGKFSTYDGIKVGNVENET